MQSVTLSRSGLRLSRLGFGCAALTSSDRPTALRLLGTALDAGISHFDVARAYGLGQAEQILGEFIRGRRTQVTITTKLGMRPPALAAANPSLVALAKRVLRRLPWIDRAARRHVQRMVTTGAFDVASAGASLEESLRALGTDYVDMLLLHECTQAEASSPALLTFLDEERRRGRIRTYGIATAVNHLPDDAAQLPPPLDIVQLTNNVLEPHLQRVRGLLSRDVVTHSPFKHLDRIQSGLRSDSHLASRAREAFDIDPERREDIARWMLHFALLANAHGPILFASSHESRVRLNAGIAAETLMSERVAGFAELARAAAEAADGAAGPSRQE